jgi:hypothetical protein
MVLDEEVRLKEKSDMKEEELHNFETAEQLFDYYEKIPIILEYEADEFQELYQQMTRGAIIKALGKGIEDYYPGTNEKKVRHALSAMEILEVVNKLIKEDKHGKFAEIGEIKKANLFFHLNKLEDAGFIKEIGVIKSGRRRTTYFGRTANIYITFGMDQMKAYTLFENETFIDLLKAMNPQKSEEQIRQTLTKLEILNNDTSKYFVEWIRKNEAYFKKYLINYVELLKIISLMHRFTHEAVDGLQELSELLHLDVSKLPENRSED